MTDRVPGFGILEAEDAPAIRDCRELMLEYQAGLGVDLCFQGFARELAGLPGDYAPPRGCLLLATRAGHPAGCVALRPLSSAIAEMKRFYVRPEHRGTGLGRALVEGVLARARAIGYATVKLDTLPSMDAAQQLYARVGFRVAAPYNDNALAGTCFMEIDLGSTAQAARNPRAQRR